MRTLHSTFFILISFGLFAQGKIIGEIFDANGNRLYTVEDTGQLHKKGSTQGEVTNHVLRFHHIDGRHFDYDYDWDQIVVDGWVIVNFNFNKDSWQFLDQSKIAPGKSPKQEQVLRSYAIIFENYRTNPAKSLKPGSTVTSFEQGNIPLLTFIQGRGFVNEFDQVVYVLNDSLVVAPNQKGSHVPAWCVVILMHDYYEEYYIGDGFEKITQQRKIKIDSLENTNSMMMDMLTLGQKYETEETTVLGQHYKMKYFTTIDEKIIVLREEQLKSIINKWVIPNAKTRISSRPFFMPSGGAYVSRGKAKKLGIEGIEGNTLILEVSLKPSFKSEFESVILK